MKVRFVSGRMGVNRMIKCGTISFAAKRGIFGVQTVGALSCDPQRFSNEYSGLFTKAGILPKRKLTRYFVTPNAAIKVRV